MVIKINRENFVQFVRENVNGTTIATVDLDSDLDSKMRKTGNPFLGIGAIKRMTLNGILGYIYGDAVNRQALKEGKEIREAKMHPWGDMDKKHLFRIHRKTLKPYLSMKVEKTDVHGYFDRNGNPIDKKEIEQFIPEKSVSSTQADLQKEIIARDYNLDNIKKIRAFGNEFELID